QFVRRSGRPLFTLFLSVLEKTHNKPSKDQYEIQYVANVVHAVHLFFLNHRFQKGSRLFLLYFRLCFFSRFICFFVSLDWMLRCLALASSIAAASSDSRSSAFFSSSLVRCFTCLDCACDCW